MLACKDRLLDFGLCRIEPVYRRNPASLYAMELAALRLFLCEARTQPSGLKDCRVVQVETSSRGRRKLGCRFYSTGRLMIGYMVVDSVV